MPIPLRPLLGRFLGCAAPLALLLGCASTSESSQLPSRDASYNVDDDGVAIDGYDPVSYFPEGGGSATPGQETLALDYAGAHWYFSSEANRERFRNAPETYAPSYGGYCAYAVAEGKKVDVDPTRFLIQDGRLLLFYHSFLADTRARWQRRPRELLARADAHWAGRGGSQVAPLTEATDASLPP